MENDTAKTFVASSAVLLKKYPQVIHGHGTMDGTTEYVLEELEMLVEQFAAQTTMPWHLQFDTVVGMVTHFVFGFESLSAMAQFGKHFEGIISFHGFLGDDIFQMGKFVLVLPT